MAENRDPNGTLYRIPGATIDFIKSTAGNTRAGTFVCNGTSNVTITTTAASANMIVLITLNTVGGTVGALPRVTTITAGTSFTVAGSASDTSTYNYLILSLSS